MSIYPKTEHGIVNHLKNSIFSYSAWASVCRDEDGVLYAVSSGMRVDHVCPFGKTVMYISKNDGKTWSPPIIINDDYLDDRDAGILYIGNGRMLVTWFAHSKQAYLNRYYGCFSEYKRPAERDAMVGILSTYDLLPEELIHGGSFIRVSDDYGMTWSETIKVPVSAPHGPNLLRDGSLLYLGKEMYLTEEDNNTHGQLCAYKSTDGGYHWKKLAIIPRPEGLVARNLCEPHVIETADGKLLGAIRVQGPEVAENIHNATIYFTESSDGGLTWSMPSPTGIHGSPPHFMIHSSGALILSYGRRIEPFGERAIVSYDCGKTWSDEYVLVDDSPNEDIGYPATVELRDGGLLTVYYQRLPSEDKCSILCTKWRLAERD